MNAKCTTMGDHSCADLLTTSADYDQVDEEAIALRVQVYNREIGLC